MDTIKVLQVNKLYYPHIGGIEKHLYLLCNELTRRPQFDVTALVCNTRFRTEVENSSNFKLVRVASPGTFVGMPYAFSLPLWLHRLRADIIHIHHPFPPGELAYLLARPESKVVVTWHSDIVRQRGAMVFYRPFLHQFLKRVDCIILASSNYLKVSSYLRAFKEKCIVIPYGIDTLEFQLTPEVKSRAEAIRSQYGSPLLLFVGRLVYYKGLEYLIRAMQRVDAKLLIVGEGALEYELRALAAHLGLVDRIVFLQHASAEGLAAYYHACDLFVLPSVEISEAFSLVQLEAMSCGKPVVSTDLPTGVTFANQHRKTGFVVPIRDPEALSCAINLLLHNPALRQQYGNYARNRVEHEFTKQVMTDKVVQLYRELIGLT